MTLTKVHFTPEEDEIIIKEVMAAIERGEKIGVLMQRLEDGPMPTHTAHSIWQRWAKLRNQREITAWGSAGRKPKLLSENKNTPKTADSSFLSSHVTLASEQPQLAKPDTLVDQTPEPTNPATEAALAPAPVDAVTSLRHARAERTVLEREVNTSDDIGNDDPDLKNMLEWANKALSNTSLVAQKYSQMASDLNAALAKLYMAQQRADEYKKKYETLYSLLNSFRNLEAGIRGDIAEPAARRIVVDQKSGLVERVSY